MKLNFKDKDGNILMELNSLNDKDITVLNEDLRELGKEDGVKVEIEEGKKDDEEDED